MKIRPMGFNPRTVQPEASRYTDYATCPTVLCSYYFSFLRGKTSILNKVTDHCALLLAVCILLYVDLLLRNVIMFYTVCTLDKG
jgi:hypothetical protein